MLTFIGLVVVAGIILFKRSTGIITINPMRGIGPAAPVLRGPEGDEPDAPEPPSAQGRAAILQMVRNNQFIEAMQLYRRMYGVDLQTAKKAVEKMMLEK